MARYRINQVDPETGETTGVFDNDTGWSIPKAEGNRDWRQYLEWVAEGNAPDPME